MKLRLEREADFREVEQLTREAFWNVYCPGCSEHLVLHKLRQDPCFLPELDTVLEEDGRIVASIAYARGRLHLDAGGEAEVPLFGPVGVLPEYQGKGYGSKLITETLEKAKELGWPAVVITGNPAYYKRFGFESASKHGIYLEGEERTEEAPFFLIKVLREEGAKGLRGVYSIPACYTVEGPELEEFDSSFPKKKKEVRPGQLH